LSNTNPTKTGLNLDDMAGEEVTTPTRGIYCVTHVKSPMINHIR